MNNPKCRKVEIGVRHIREITIWPLSLASELEFSSKIVGLVEGFEFVSNPPAPIIPDDATDEELQAIADSIPNTDVLIANYIITAIQDNLIDLLAYVTDDPVTLDDLDNELAIDLVGIIYEMNFEGAVGKGKLLLGKVKNLFQQKKPLENLSSQPVTATNTSSSSDTETEE